jgi:hypothetical protein
MGNGRRAKALRALLVVIFVLWLMIYTAPKAY